LQGGAATKRAQYEAKWHTFITSKDNTNISYDDVPWLAIDAPGENVKAMILYGTDGANVYLRNAPICIC